MEKMTYILKHFVGSWEDHTDLFLDLEKSFDSKEALEEYLKKYFYDEKGYDDEDEDDVEYVESFIDELISEDEWLSGDEDEKWVIESKTAEDDANNLWNELSNEKKDKVVEAIHKELSEPNGDTDVQDILNELFGEKNVMAYYNEWGHTH